MINYTIRRLIIAIITIFCIASFIFFLVHLVPGDPAYFILGDRATPDAVEALRGKLGLDKPLLVQYKNWFIDILHLDFGKSLYDNTPVGPQLITRLGRTFELILGSLSIASILGISLGIWAANGNKATDYGITFLSVIGLSCPAIVIGPIVTYIFGVRFNILPSSGFTPLGEDFLTHIRYLIMPVTSLSIFSLGVITRMTRSCVLEELRMDYKYTALAKGLKKFQVIIKHVVKNSMIPIITLIGTRMGLMLGGTVIAEKLFNWPGLSTYLINGAFHRDYPVIQGVVIIIATVFVFLNLIVDLIVGFIDPRIKYE